MIFKKLNKYRSKYLPRPRWGVVHRQQRCARRTQSSPLVMQQSPPVTQQSLVRSSSLGTLQHFLYPHCARLGALVEPVPMGAKSPRRTLLEECNSSLGGGSKRNTTARVKRNTNRKRNYNRKRDTRRKRNTNRKRDTRRKRNTKSRGRTYTFIGALIFE